MPEQWWESRREGERTNVYLARVLQAMGPKMREIAEQAERYWYDDFFAPEESGDMGDNIHRLVEAIDSASRSADRVNRIRARAVIAAAKEGEFDGTREEARYWAASPDGQETFNLLLRRGFPPSKGS